MIYPVSMMRGAFGSGTPSTPVLDYQGLLDKASTDGWLGVYDASNPSKITTRAAAPDTFITALSDGLVNLDDYSMATESMQPKLISVTNGGQSFDAGSWDGSNDQLNQPKSATDVQKSLPITLAVVVRPTTASVAGHIWGSQIETRYRGWWIQLSGSNELAFGYADGGIVSSTSRRSKATSEVISSGTWAVVTIVARGATNMDIRRDGVDVGGSYSGSGGALQYEGTTGTTLGASWGTKHSMVDIAWAGFYNGDAVGDGVLASMEEELMKTFGVT